MMKTAVRISLLVPLIGVALGAPVAEPQQWYRSTHVKKQTQQQSSVPFGQVIQSCTVPGTVALTFDDGPYIYTNQVLDVLKENGVHATFFLNGLNYGDITSAVDVATVQRMDAEGHQIGSHTMYHTDLTTQSEAEMLEAMNLLANDIAAILGKWPTYMRPPYFATNDLVLQTMGGLGYHVIQADIDTKDYENDAPDLIHTAETNFVNGLNNGGSIELSHDVHQWTANVLVQAMINDVKSRGLTPVTVGECLGDPPELWYKS